MSSQYWYALTVKPRSERTASQYLRDKGFAEFSPVYRARRRWSDRWKEVELCLFPGYVFCRFSYEERLQVLGTPGINSIVGFAKTPMPVPEEEIAAIRTMVGSGRRVEPWPHLRAGERVRIKEGCLQGVCGALVREKDRWRVIVSVDLLERSVAVEVDRESVTPMPGRVGLAMAGSILNDNPETPGADRIFRIA
jgi:transcription antitermination factor NusG